MNDADRAIVAAAEERDRAVWRYEGATNVDLRLHYFEDVTHDDYDCAASERRELLRIVREQERELSDRADGEAAERATSGKWGGWTTTQPKMHGSDRKDEPIYPERE